MNEPAHGIRMFSDDAESELRWSLANTVSVRPVFEHEIAGLHSLVTASVFCDPFFQCSGGFTYIYSTVGLSLARSELLIAYQTDTRINYPFDLAHGRLLSVRIYTDTTIWVMTDIF